MDTGGSDASERNLGSDFSDWAGVISSVCIEVTGFYRCDPDSSLLSSGSDLSGVSEGIFCYYSSMYFGLGRSIISSDGLTKLKCSCDSTLSWAKFCGFELGSRKFSLFDSDF